MSKILDAKDILGEARDWMAHFFQGRSREEIERIKDWLHVEFPPPAPAAPAAKPKSRAARTKRSGK
jgi:hypothetical protein